MMIDAWLDYLPFAAFWLPLSLLAGQAIALSREAEPSAADPGGPPWAEDPNVLDLSPYREAERG